MSDKWIAPLTVIITGLVYLTGYSYLDGFYNYYNLELVELEISPQEVLAHSFVVYKQALFNTYKKFIDPDSLLIFLILAAVFFTLASLVRGFRVHGLTQVTLRAASIIVLFIILGFIIILQFLAQRIGEEMAHKEFLSLSTVEIVDLNDEIGLKEFRSRNPGTRMRHVATTKTMYYILLYWEEGDRWLVKVPKVKVEAIRTNSTLFYPPQ